MSRGMWAGTGFMCLVYAALRHGVQQFLGAINLVHAPQPNLLHARAIPVHHPVSVKRVDCRRDITR